MLPLKEASSSVRLLRALLENLESHEIHETLTTLDAKRISELGGNVLFTGCRRS